VTRKLKNDIIDNLCRPLQFQVGSSIETWHGFDRLGINKNQFMIAFNLVITALDAGYYPTHKTPLLGAQDWSTLSSTVLAAIGRGYAHTHSQYNEDYLGHIQRTTLDRSTSRSNPPFNNMFDRLTATAEHLHTYLAPDNEEAVGWINDLKEKTQFFTAHYATETMAEALDKWKVYQIRECTNDLEEYIRCAIAEASKGRLMDAAAQMGLFLKEDPLCTPRRNPSHVAKQTPTESPAHRGWKPRQPSQNPPESDDTTAMPCQTAQRPEPILTDIAAIIRVAISPVVSRLEALERLSMPPPTLPPACSALATATNEPPEQPGNRVRLRQHQPTTLTTRPPTPLLTEEEWTAVALKSRSRKKKGNRGTTTNPAPSQQAPGIQGAVNLVPGSFAYAMAARQAANLTQPTATPNAPKVTTMEVTVLCFGGHLDRQVETIIRAHAANAIAREVREATEKAVNRPIQIITGRWSIGP
jgi:hypothetical protein